MKILEIKQSTIGAFFFGCVITIILLVIIALANSEPCARCGEQCTDSAIYCSQCGQQLRIVDKLKEK